MGFGFTPISIEMTSSISKSVIKGTAGNGLVFVGLAITIASVNCIKSGCCSVNAQIRTFFCVHVRRHDFHSMQTPVRPTNQVSVFQSLAEQPAYSAVNLHHRIQLPDILPGTELVHILLQVLRTHLVIDTVVSALQARPERFRPVSVGLSFHIFANRVLD